MENPMNIENQRFESIEQNTISQSVNLPGKPKTNWRLIGGIVLVCFVVFGFGGYYLGKQSAPPQKETTDLQSQTSPSPIPNADNPTVSENKSIQPGLSCTTTFSSKYLKMSFKYDRCVWKLSENLITPEAGVYSTITAKHNSNHQVVINANTMGMGGSHPECSEVNDITLLDDGIVRIRMLKNPLTETPKYYYYLSDKHDYAIKGYSGKHGDEKFNEYFTFLNPEAFPNTNICWKSGGINPVAVLQPKKGKTKPYQINKDITVSIKEENISDKEFLKAADSLAVEIYSSLNQ